MACYRVFRRWSCGILPSFLILISGVLSQKPHRLFSSPEDLRYEPGPESGTYNFQWPIRRVAIIGGGSSGLVAYREFVQAGFDVHLYERDTVPGGNWHCTDETPPNAPIPNIDVSIGDYEPSLPPEGVRLPYEENYEGELSEEIMRAHRAPKPVWKSLETNTPPPLQQFAELPWPPGQPWPLPQEKVGKYVRAFASYHGINSNDLENPRISYNTRVERVQERFVKDGRRAGWQLTLKQLVRTSEHSTKAIWTTEDFDAVVVATGRYNAPYIPNIPGLTTWNDQFPDGIAHSRQYRRPDQHINKTVLVVGAAASGVEISADLDRHASKIYQSIRVDNSTAPHFPASIRQNRLPKRVTVVPEIKRFLPPTLSINTSRIELVNGSILTGIDSVIFATGFRYSFPFLPQFHNSSVGHNETNDKVIVTDGTHLRNLYLGIISIEEPTLGFVCMNQEIHSFQYAEYISVALSKVWGRKATIPSTQQLWKWNEGHVLEKGGYGKNFQYLGRAGMRKMVRFFVGWLNEEAAKYGGRQIDGEGPGEQEIAIIWFLARFGVDLSMEGVPGSELAFNSFTPYKSLSASRRLAYLEERIDELMYGYDW